MKSNQVKISSSKVFEEFSVKKAKEIHKEQLLEKWGLWGMKKRESSFFLCLYDGCSCYCIGNNMIMGSTDAFFSYFV